MRRRVRRRTTAVTVALSLALVLAAAGTTGTDLRRTTKPATLIAVGDIGSCTSTDDEATAALVARIPGTLAILGDAAYDDGSRLDFDRCYLPAWGRFLPRTRAALGNHDYANGASDGATAKEVFGLPDTGWYSYRLGTWHVVVLNSNCDIVDCRVGSPQWRWLRADLARSRRTRCTLAYWHHARFSSGEHGSDVRLAPFWDLLARAHADLVLAGHDHIYERFGALKGIRSFVVGTGGKSHYPIGVRRAGSEVANDDTFGVLRLSLGPIAWSWRFVAVPGSTFSDAGSARCR
jgi:calcineurin-like phosphoesterase family protein